VRQFTAVFCIATRYTDTRRWYGAAGPVLSPAQIANAVAFIHMLNDGCLP
jgi:hypothetical protein